MLRRAADALGGDPHTFRHLFGVAGDLTALDLVEPAHSQAIGLVLSARDPLPPMASAFLAATLDFHFPGDW